MNSPYPNSAAMHHAATHDAATGLPNRDEFMSRLDSALATAARTGGGVALLFVGLDGTVAPGALPAFAARLSARVRRTDVVARVADDAFAVLLTHLADPAADTRALAGKMLAAAAPCSASVGIALDDGNLDGATLVTRAETALRDARGRGGNTAVLFEPPAAPARGPADGAPLPPDETARVEALRATQLLDSEPDELFDRIVRIVCTTLNVPVSLVSLVDSDRQWFKARCGIEGRETPRTVAFCAWTVLDDEPFVVEDAARDPRFADNPHVTGAPFVRFYAGVPLRSGGRRIGSLCAVDYVPRTLGPQDLLVLKQLARMVEDLIELRTATLDAVQSLNNWGGRPLLEGGTGARLRQQFLRDPLTGMPNRLVVEDAIARHALRAHADTCALLAVVDVDNLAAVNEEHGHASGDAVLVAIARRLRHRAGPGDVAARIGGSTFLLWLQSDTHDCAERAQALHRALNRPVQVAGRVIHGSVTMGHCHFGRDGNDAETLLVRAHAALRHAKSQGHGLARAYEPAQRRTSARALEHDLRGALARDELALAYQPKVDLRSGRVVGVEALLRWQHPVYGMVAPSEFIPVAEESGLIIPIGQWVLDQACAQLRAWRDAGHAGLTVAVNLSARQFLDDEVAARVVDTLARHGVPHGALELELTESTSMHDVGRSITIMKELKAAGVVLSIDDFGTGYSSLAYLKRLPIDKVKIDRAFVSDLEQSTESRAIVRAIVTAVRCLGLDVIAEGIEQPAQARLLMADGCFEMQGYHFGRPVAAADCPLEARFEFGAPEEA
ncbi:EAL domain-containing protein [Telluria mixta]|uniref:EAL domain-containing protein n=1 Tax=Telluria mixta TaxID=34071 RepID=A0ABT2C7X5_9BURK|nr:EAL domain-containing protein [Telluria mixta]MCS0633242.1 EAL domain-containing protein [Telluria mixta]WEM94725.1 EAL domain-containing protein [Telluria mixta]